MKAQSPTYKTNFIEKAMKLLPERSLYRYNIEKGSTSITGYEEEILYKLKLGK